MPWTLKIVHIDVGASGDSTLFIASNGGLSRSVLVDGGGLSAVPLVTAVLAAENVNALDVMVATHYDQDHFNGLRGLLAGGSPVFDFTRIYDQGQQGTPTAKMKSGGTPSLTFFGEETGFIAYRNAIKQVATRVWVTEQVVNTDGLGANLTAAGCQRSSTLVSREVMWDGYAGPARPAGYPTLTCIAANQSILQPNDAVRVVTSSALTKERQKNANSLAFLLQFGNFRYYIGGDIEARQESGHSWDGATYVADATSAGRSLQRYITGIGRVHAMKTSHHGSKFSSAPQFLTALNPRVAFISCGTDNRYGHPDQPVVTNLEANNTSYYLTGEHLNADVTIGPLGTVAGVFAPGTQNPAAQGDVRLTITQAQAGQAAPGFDVTYNRAAGGTNRAKNPAFVYMPVAARVRHF